jgi:hypothetical protein
MIRIIVTVFGLCGLSDYLFGHLIISKEVQELGVLHMKYKELSVALYYDLLVFYDVYHMILLLFHAEK